MCVCLLLSLQIEIEEWKWLLFFFHSRFRGCFLYIHIPFFKREENYCVQIELKLRESKSVWKKWVKRRRKTNNLLRSLSINWMRRIPSFFSIVCYCMCLCMLIFQEFFLSSYPHLLDEDIMIHDVKSFTFSLKDSSFNYNLRVCMWCFSTFYKGKSWWIIKRLIKFLKWYFSTLVLTYVLKYLLEFTDTFL